MMNILTHFFGFYQNNSAHNHTNNNAEEAGKFLICFNHLCQRLDRLTKQPEKHDIRANYA